MTRSVSRVQNFPDDEILVIFCNYIKIIKNFKYDRPKYNHSSSSEPELKQYKETKKTSKQSASKPTFTLTDNFFTMTNRSPVKLISYRFPSYKK